MASKIIVGLVIDIQPFQEFDNIIKIISATKFYTILALGTRKSTSKNAYNISIGSISELEIFEARKINAISKLKKAKIIYPFDVTNNNNQKIYSQLFNFLSHLDSTSYDFFNTLVNIWRLWGNNNFLIFIYILNQSLKLKGIYPIFDSCIECNNTDNFTNFDYFAGGIICYLHAKENEYLKARSYYYLDKDLDQFIKVTDQKTANLIFYELTQYLYINGYTI